MALNVFFVLLHYLLYLLYAGAGGARGADSLLWRDVALIVLQCKTLYEACESVFGPERMQTQSFVTMRKLDAISRSAPSSILQTFAIMLMLSDSSDSSSSSSFDLWVLVTSVASSLFGISITLAVNHDFSGDSMLSLGFLIAAAFHLCELVVRGA